MVGADAGGLIRCVVKVLHRLVRRQGPIIGRRERLILINQAYNSDMRRNRVCAQAVWIAASVQGFMVQTHDVRHLWCHQSLKRNHMHHSYKDVCGK